MVITEELIQISSTSQSLSNLGEVKSKATEFSVIIASPTESNLNSFVNLFIIWKVNSFNSKNDVSYSFPEFNLQPGQIPRLISLNER